MPSGEACPPRSGPSGGSLRQPRLPYQFFWCQTVNLTTWHQKNADDRAREWLSGSVNRLGPGSPLPTGMNELTGDTEADYDEWFRACFPRAVAVARRVVGSDGAEDAAVEAFAAAYARWKRVGGLPWRDGWVCRTAFHQALAQARGTGRQPEPPAAALPLEDGVVLRTSMVQALRRLPRRQREAVALRYLIDLPEREVAAVLGVSTGSVKVHLHRGLAALRATPGPDSWEERPDVLSP